MAKQYDSVQAMLDDSGRKDLADDFRKSEPWRNLVAAIRKWWSFDSNQQHTHSWHDREDFILNALPDLVDAVAKLPQEPRQVIRLSINGRKPIALEPADAATIISELASALADGCDCLIEV